MATNGMTGLRVLAVEGDESALTKLCALLGTFGAVQSIDAASSPALALRRIGALRPAFVLLAIDLPGAAGLPPLRGPDAPCIAVMSAQPALALPGCDLEALDVLVKPVSRERLAESLRRAQHRLAERRIAALAIEIAGMASAIRGLPGAAPAASGCFPDQMTIRVRRRMFALPVADITWIEGASQYSRVHAKAGEYLLSRSLASLECELDPSRFFRIHRSAIVNAAYVSEVMSRGDGRYNVYLRGGPALPLGRGRRETLQRLLGGISARGSHLSPV